MKKPIRTLSNWSMTKYKYNEELVAKLGIECAFIFSVSGTVVADESDKMEIGWHCRSTAVLKWDELNQIAETKNTLYRLIGDEGTDEIKRFVEQWGGSVNDVFY